MANPEWVPGSISPKNPDLVAGNVPGEWKYTGPEMVVSQQRRKEMVDELAQSGSSGDYKKFIYKLFGVKN